MAKRLERCSVSPRVLIQYLAGPFSWGLASMLHFWLAVFSERGRRLQFEGCSLLSAASHSQEECFFSVCFFYLTGETLQEQVPTLRECVYLRGCVLQDILRWLAAFYCWRDWNHWTFALIVDLYIHTFTQRCTLRLSEAVFSLFQSLPCYFFLCPSILPKLKFPFFCVFCFVFFKLCPSKAADFLPTRLGGVRF